MTTDSVPSHALVSPAAPVASDTTPSPVQPTSPAGPGQKPTGAASSPTIPGMPAADQARGREQVVVRFHATPAQQVENDRRMKEAEWPHASPNSVYIAAMGNHWRPGSWARVMDMMQAAQEQGILCVLEELQDRCLEPYDALGTMRNEAWMKANAGGFEFVLYVDNDVLPPKDTLIRLVKSQQLVVAPWIQEPAKPTGEPSRILHGPTFGRYEGLKKVKWHVLTMFLMRTNVLAPWLGSFWEDARGADEGFHFQKLWAGTGVQPSLDTDAIVEVWGPPTYPLTVHKLNPDEKAAFWQGRKDWLYSTADRKPLDPAETRVDPNGIYLPFLPPKLPAVAVPVAGSIAPAPPAGTAAATDGRIVQIPVEQFENLLKVLNTVSDKADRALAGVAALTPKQEAKA